MTATLSALSRVRFAQEAAEVQKRWDSIISISGAQAEPERDRCIPRQILETFAEEAHHGVSSMGCRIAPRETKDVVHGTPNQAWAEFWQDPQNYVAWERGAVVGLGEPCSADFA